MPSLVYLEQTYDCATAIKGDDYIHLLDDNGCMVASFDGITDFSEFTLQNGTYTSPTADHDCYVAVMRDDGTLGKGGHTCADIGVAMTTASSAATAAANAQATAESKAASGHKHAAGDITSGTLAVGRGGTGVTANPSMLTDLASTTATGVFAASPRPGVTGTLGLGNGGTGQTTAPKAMYALVNGSTSMTSAGIATGDLIPIGDISATGGAKITFANFKAALGIGMTKIYETTTTTDTTQINVTVSSLGLTGYSKIIIIPDILMNEAGNSTNIRMRINKLSSDSSYYGGSTNSNRNYAAQLFRPNRGSFASSAYSGSSEIHMQLSGKSISWITFAYASATTYGSYASGGGMYDTTLAPSAISTINFFDNNGGTLNAGSKITIYGVK